MNLFKLLFSAVMLFAVSTSSVAQVAGCMDSNACNYSSGATEDDGSCCFNCTSVSITGGVFPAEIAWTITNSENSVIAFGVGAGSWNIGCLSLGCYSFNMFDSFGDGWDSGGYVISDNSGVIASGTMSTGTEQVVFFGNTGNEGCSDPLACNYNANASCTVGCVFAGCTDAAACNYDPSAGCDDGSCFFGWGCTSVGACNYNSEALCDDGSCNYNCVSCMDPEACNFNPDATIDDGSCCYSNCLVLMGYDSFGDGWNGGTYTVQNTEGQLFYEGTVSFGNEQFFNFCLPVGCYTISVTGGSFPSEITWTLEGSNVSVVQGGAPSESYFTVGLEAPCGCTDETACNYSEFAIQDDGTCLYGNACWGCLDMTAVNFDDIAIWDDGTCQYNVTANVFFDANGSGTYDYTEFGLNGWSVYIEEIDATLYSDEFGYFYLSEFESGTYTLTINTDNPNWNSTSPTTQTINIPGDSFSAQFGFTPAGTEALFQISDYQSLGVLLCQNGVDYALVLDNVGAVNIDGTITMTYDETLTVSEAPGLTPPTESGPGYSTWTIGGQAPGSTFMYGVHFNGPGVDFLGDLYTINTSVVLSDANEVYFENTFSEEMTVACSYDPNDKQASPVGYAEPHFILPGERIEYTIRFQNTGNYPAEDVTIKDQIDLSVFDLSTFEHGYGSAPFYTCVQNDGLIEFKFNDIFLPDSTNDEPNSHGQVVFSIQTYPDLQPGVEINNFAAIYFDLNPPVITNTTWHTIFDCTSFTEIVSEGAYCENTNIVLSADQNYVESYQWEMDGIFAGNEPTLEMSTLDPGTYNVTVSLENPLCANLKETVVTINEVPGTVVVENGSTLVGPVGTSWQWYLNGESIEGAIAQEYEAMSEGVYHVVTTNEFGCTSTSTEVFVVGVGEAENQLAFVYPNPANDIINIALPQGVWNMKMYNTSGQLVYSKESSVNSIQTVDISTFAEGVYQLILKNGTRVEVLPISID
jgi:uncharacterized repeat protein (TIGR01451 family)